MPVVVSLASELLFYFYARIWFITVLLKWHESNPPKAGLCEWIRLIGFAEQWKFPQKNKAYGRRSPHHTVSHILSFGGMRYDMLLPFHLEGKKASDIL